MNIVWILRDGFSVFTSLHRTAANDVSNFPNYRHEKSCSVSTPATSPRHSSLNTHHKLDSTVNMPNTEFGLGSERISEAGRQPEPTDKQTDRERVGENPVCQDISRLLRLDIPCNSYILIGVTSIRYRNTC